LLISLQTTTGYAESAIHHYRNLLERFRTLTGVQDYAKWNETILANLNDRPNPLTGIKPKYVTSANAGVVWEKKYGKKYLDHLLSETDAKFAIGDIVRISYSKSSKFEKGTKPRFSQELFVIARVRDTTPMTYYVADLDGNQLVPPFYETQLRRVEKDFTKHRRIEKILKQDDTKTQVKWKGIPDSSSFRTEWIPTEEVKLYQTPHPFN